MIRKAEAMGGVDISAALRSAQKDLHGGSLLWNRELYFGVKDFVRPVEEALSRRMRGHGSYLSEI